MEYAQVVVVKCKLVFDAAEPIPESVGVCVHEGGESRVEKIHATNENLLL